MESETRDRAPADDPAAVDTDAREQEGKAAGACGTDCHSGCNVPPSYALVGTCIYTTYHASNGQSTTRTIPRCAADAFWLVEPHMIDYADGARWTAGSNESARYTHMYAGGPCPLARATLRCQPGARAAFLLLLAGLTSSFQTCQGGRHLSSSCRPRARSWPDPARRPAYT